MPQPPSLPAGRWRPSPRHWPWRLVAGLLALAAIAGCASKPLEHRALTGDPERSYPGAVELADTAFFPDDTYHCGPAALATVLVASGVDTTADALVEQVYLPERKGSLQHELLGAARRAGRVPLELSGSLEDLFREVSSGRPGLVLLSLTPKWLPTWHYAVVVGYDLAAGTVTLRSGDKRRAVMPLRRFERSWRRADRWAMVVPRPGRTPTTADPGSWVAAVAELERQERWDAALAGYLAATMRWPGYADAWLGLGNVRYAESQYQAAAKAFRQAAGRDPELAAAHHNLAWALLRQGKPAAAKEAARRSEALAPDHPRYSEALEAIEAEAD